MHQTTFHEQSQEEQHSNRTRDENRVESGKGGRRVFGSEDGKETIVRHRCSDAHSYIIGESL